MSQVLATVTTNLTYTCGDIGLNFNGMLPYVVSMIITIIKIVVPVLLIIFGMMDLAKAIMAQKEDEIKKGQQTFIKRIIAAVIVFFVITIVQMIVSFISNDDGNITSCFNCFVNGDAGDNACRLENSSAIGF